ncbi:unnamed protein product [Nippostrongylus brasiliensis]|uniref:Uncharacterized protein n=1 Tax=Nippostrongylus brasiliensis TaxID=27835 RepID=A0A0N4Y9B3_NIPBR|nr:unnamed protein product [Nippostrongylus brasiliensis]
MLRADNDHLDDNSGFVLGVITPLTGDGPVAADRPVPPHLFQSAEHLCLPGVTDTTIIRRESAKRELLSAESPSSIRTENSLTRQGWVIIG